MQHRTDLTAGVSRRILVINPNSNPAVTDRVRRVAEKIASPGTAMTVVNPATGPFSIESAEDRAEAESRLIPLIESSLPERFDGYVLACFDDIGIAAARAMIKVPFVGSCEAGFAAARTFGRRFAVVTTVESAIPTIHGLLARYGAAGIATVRAAGIGVAMAAANDGEADARIAATIRLAIDVDGVDAILLGSGGLAGRADALSRVFSVPVIDATAAAIKMAEGLASLRAPQWRSPD